MDYLGWEDLGSGTYTMSTKERLVGLQPTAESFRTDTRSAGKFGFSTGFHGNFELGIKNYELADPEDSSTLALAFGKPIAKNDASVIRRRLPPLSPQITNLRGPRLIGERLEARIMF